MRKYAFSISGNTNTDGVFGWNSTLLRTCQVLVLSLFLFSFGADIQAQGPPCYPDCHNSIYQPVYPAPAWTTTITLDCGATVTVYYRTRYACNTWYDLYIESYEFNSPYEGWLCGHTMTAKEMMDDLTEKMLIQNPMNFPPFNEGECETNYRIFKGTCWYPTFEIVKVFENVSINPEAYTGSLDIIPAPFWPCPQTTCCLDAFHVCIVNGQKVITHFSNTPGMCPSPVPPSPFQIFPCYEVCY